MNQMQIFIPMFCMVFLTLLVWVYMYARRIPFILTARLNPDQMTPLELARLSPRAVSNPSDNLKNLFEIPTIFYVLVLYLYVTHQVDTTDLVAAWIFVGFRALHSLVHCTFNHVLTRFWLYVISTVALWFIAVRAAFLFGATH